MKVSTLLLSKRAIRSALFSVAALVALGLLLLGDATALRVLGAVGGVLIAVLLKVAAEQFVQLQHMEATLRAAGKAAESSTLDVREARSMIREAQHRLARVEAAVFDDGGIFARAQDQTERRIQEHRDDLSRVIDDVTIKMDELIAVWQPVRRHVVRVDLPLRELGLRDSLAGLVTEAEVEAPE